MRENAAVMAQGPLLSQYADDPEMLEIVALFVSEVPDRLRELQAAWDASDLRCVRTLAHQIKGAAGGYGFPEISTAAAALEAALSTGAARAAAGSVHASSASTASNASRAVGSSNAPGSSGSGGSPGSPNLVAAKPAFASLAMLLTRVVMAG